MVIRDSDLGNSGVARAMFLAGAVAVGGAVVWGLLGAYAEMQSWIVAVAIGLAVGWVVTRVVERITMPLQVATVLFTLGAVVLGQVLIVAFSMNQDFGIFDLPLSWRLYRAVAFDEALGDLLFGLAGGAIGAFYALRMMKRKTTIAAQPQPPGVAS